MITRQVIIHGRVQGVFFRDYTRKMAILYKLTGWTRNLPDGSVEAVLCGEDKTVAKMLTWLQQGSPLSRVSSIDINDIDVAERLSSFEIRY